MRDIKFRARRKLNGDWVFGSYVKSPNEDWCLIVENSSDDDCVNINEVDHYRVITSTVGQFTGLKDKNGVEIYEGDKCKTYEVGLGNLVREVVFDSGSFGFKHEFTLFCELRGMNTDYIEVIGNIYQYKRIT